MEVSSCCIEGLMMAVSNLLISVFVLLASYRDTSIKQGSQEGSRSGCTNWALTQNMMQLLAGLHQLIETRRCVQLWYGNVVKSVKISPFCQTSDKCYAFRDVTLGYGDGITVQLRTVQKYSSVISASTTHKGNKYMVEKYNLFQH